MAIAPLPARATATQPLAFRAKDPSTYARHKAAAAAAYERFEHKKTARETPQATPQTVISGGLNQAGLNASDAGGGTPPDTTGAIGPSNYVELVNSEIAVYSRSSLGSPTAQEAEKVLSGTSYDTCDGQIQWDQQGQRWLYSMLECDPTAPSEQLYLGWSKTPSPDLSPSNWCQYTLDTGSTIEDYPKLGHDDTQIIIGANEFNDVSQNYLGSRIFVFDKPAPGDQTCPSQSTLQSHEFTTSADFTPVPANLADSSSTGYVVALNSDQSHITLYTIGRSGGGSGTSQVNATNSVAIAPYDIPSNVPQPGTSDVIDSSDTRLTQAVATTDPATGTESVWTQHTIAGPGGGPSVVRWYELTPGATTPRQTGTITGPNGTFAFNGAISPTADGRGAVVFYNSGDASHLVDLRAQSRQQTTSLGVTTGDIQLGTSSSTDQDFSCVSPYGPPCRWGDYAGASPDPVDSALVWGTGELTTIPADGTNDPHWGTRNAAISILPAPELTASAATGIGTATATLSGTVNPNGYATTYHFEYGPTENYGNATGTVNAGAGSSPIAASTTVTGLSAGTTYHFRMVATNVNGTTATDDQTFSTAPPPGPSVRIISPSAGSVFTQGQSVRTSFSCSDVPGGPGLAWCRDSGGAFGSTGHLATSTLGRHTYQVVAMALDRRTSAATISYVVVARLRISIVTRQTRLSRGRASVTLACAGGRPGARCTGKLSLTARKLTLASTRYSVASGKRVTVRLTLSRRAQSVVRRAPRHGVGVRASATLAGAATDRRTITLAR
jgi:hypothetical protein